MRVAAIIAAFAFLFGCEPTYLLSGPVGRAIRKEVRDSKKTEINLTNLIPFEWDELFLFEPYTPRSVICGKLGISEEGCLQEIADESTDDGEMYLVFRKAGKIVHKEMYIRFNGDFTPIDFEQPLTPENAKFSVKEAGASANGDPWLRLKLRSNQSSRSTHNKGPA